MPKILVIDDHEPNRDVLARLLERRGFAVVAADSGAAGVSLAASEMPDLVVMDLAMPEMDGFEATRRIKAMAETAAIPILALTAYSARTLTVDRALEAGCADLDTKPIDHRRLMAKIEKLLEGVAAGLSSSR